jgi:hypothetical protein
MTPVDLGFCADRGKDTMAISLTTIDELWAQERAEHERFSRLCAMLPCWEMFAMDDVEFLDAVRDSEMIALAMEESTQRSLAWCEEIGRLERAAGDPR